MTNDKIIEINEVFSVLINVGSKIWLRRLVRKIPANIMKIVRNLLIKLNIFFLTSQTRPIVTKKTVINITRELPTDPGIELPNGS
jgi:hypothetical protein|tara:strand:+ start:310 stop:564 length:255 start_codon:yes stop_codon:yes gene_type:complete